MEDEVRVISGTRRQVRELVDGTLEVKFHVDPRFKADFHRLFPNIDTPVAIAPLVAHFERIEEEEKQKGGALCRLAGIWCKDEDFWQWLGDNYGQGIPVENEEDAAQLLREICEVNSRREIDHDPAAEARFHNIIRKPFIEWSKSR